MITARRLQRKFADGFIAEAVEDLWEPWMRHADKALEDDTLLLLIQQELAKRCKKSKTRGRKATPAEVVLRMLLLKHVRAWSYETLSREVRANLVYREFTRVGGEKVPDDRTMGNLGRQLGPEVIEQLNRRMVEIAQEHKIAAGRKMRVDTTVVETDIHYPTDSTLLGDGVRVLTRIMKRVAGAVGKVGRQLRDRSRSAKLKVLAMARASRNKTEQGREKMKAPVDPGFRPRRTEGLPPTIGNHQPGYRARQEVCARHGRPHPTRPSGRIAQGQETTGSDDSPRPAGAAPDTRAGVARQQPSRGKTA